MRPLQFMVSEKRYLQMWLAGKLISWTEISYEGLANYKQRWDHQSSIAAALYEKHLEKIQDAKTEPEFFIDNVPSKMNEL